MSAPVLPPPADQVDLAAAEPSGAKRLTQSVWRLRLAALCICLSALAFIQEPGRIASDTKLDLAVNPGGLLARALHLWDPESFSGSLQNQAYGYLFPMGPFYLLTDTLGVPAWIAQRLWWSLLLCLAFLGVVRLARLLNLGPPLARVLGGLAYALSPLVLSKLGPISSEVLPIALAPWMLIPLVAASRGAPIRRSAAFSALAVFCMGGVNAAATLAVLPLGLIWILTREWSRETRRLLGWWLLSLAMACLWWIIPLVTLGRYSPPFLDWIEAASITTRFTDPASTLRGTSDWIAYLLDSSGPVWEMGWLFVSTFWLAVAMAIITIAGIIGLTLRKLPNRSFLVLSVLAGFLLVSIGHVGELPGFGAQFLQDSLNTFLVPFRNVHKFDPVLRLPLILGLIFFLTVCLRVVRRNPLEGGWLSRLPSRRQLRGLAVRLPVGGVMLALAITVITVLSGPITAGRSYIEIPNYWRESAQWLSQQPAGGKAMVIPGASFAQMIWGRPQDEPYQAIGGVAWDVRDAVPLGNAGHTRMLDVIGQQLESGRGSSALAEYLHRSGFNYLVVRNDIDTATLGNAQLSSIHQSLENSPGIELVKEFGPDVVRYGADSTTLNYGLTGDYAAVEVFAVTGSQPGQVPAAVLRDASNPVIVDGSAEATYRLLQRGAVGDQTVVVRNDPGTAGLSGTSIVTDTGQKQEVNFGYSRDNQSDTMEQDQPYVQRRKVHDFLNVGARLTTFAELNGAARLSASSSGSDVDAFIGRNPGATTFAAIDGDPTTAWQTGATQAQPIGSWWRIDFEKPTELSTVQLALLKKPNTVVPTKLEVITSNGSQLVDVDTKADVLDLVINQTSDFLTIKLAQVDRDSTGPFGIADVTIPGVTVQRPLRSTTDGPRDGAVFTVQYGDRDDCVRVETTYRCAPFLGRSSAQRAGIDRWVWLAGGDYQLAVDARARAGQALDGLLVPIGGTKIEASSTAYQSPLARAQAAADGSMSTAWQASPLDRNPWLLLKLPQRQTVEGVQLSNLFQSFVSIPIEIKVTIGDREFRGPIDAEGVLRFAPVQASEVKIEILTSQPVRTMFGGRTQTVPVGVSEVNVLGKLNPTLPSDGPVPFTCGFGPSIQIDGVKYPTGGTLTFHQLLTGGVADMKSCGTAETVSLPAGWHRVTADPSLQLAVDGVSVMPAQTATTNPAVAAPVDHWDATSRAVDVTAADYPRTLETSESFNPGWVASMNGQTLQPVQVDGWRQAWLVPAGTAGVVEMNFAPDSMYRWGLLLGLLAVIALVLLLIKSRTEPASVPVASRTLRWTIGISAVIVIALTGGIGGLIAGGLAVGAVLLRNQWSAARALAAATVTCALLLTIVWTWPDAQSMPTAVAMIQGAMVFASLSVVALCAMGSGSPSPRFFQRAHNEGPRE